MTRLRGAVLALMTLAFSASAVAAMAGSLKGVVHDPQHLPVPGVTVTVKALHSDWQAKAVTDALGEFEFPNVPVGEYTVSVTAPNFQAPPQQVTMVTGSSPVIHFQLAMAALNATATASAESVPAPTPTPTSLVGRDEIAATPGAARTNSLSMITSFAPGSYMTHDQLHIRGGHQVSWLIDGVPVPNTSIASNVGPQIDPKDIDYLEIQRGSYDAQYGDRTYGVFNVVPRSGFERDREMEVVTTFGSDRQTNDQISAGNHTSRAAYYVSANFNRSDLGLEPPVADPEHDGERGGGGFGSFILNATAHDQFRVIGSARRDSYQIPRTPDDLAAGIDDTEREWDGLVNVSWVRTFASKAVMTVSPFFHANSANYLGGPLDPVSTTDQRRSLYGGVQATIGALRKRHEFEAGLYTFHQADIEQFGVAFNDGSGDSFSDRESPSGTVAAVFAQDTFTAASWLTITAGVRETHVSGGVTESALSPRAGFALNVPRAHWIVRGFYGRFYQAPPLVTASGPLSEFVTSQNLAFIPLHGERDHEYQIGLTVPLHGWTLDGDHFQTRAVNFFDHNSVGNSNVFFPLTIDGALIRGWEFTLRSPHRWTRGDVHLAYSHQHADGMGGISGGLTDFSPPEGSFPLDHDQRNTLSVGTSVVFGHGLFAGASVSYGSGLPSDDGPLAGHTTVDVTAGKKLGARASLAITAVNIANNRTLIDNSLTFGGTHFNTPREIYGELRIKFHY